MGEVTLFRDYDGQLEIVSSFKYLGTLLAATYDDWPDDISNLRKSRTRWSHLARILGHEGADTRTKRALRCRCPSHYTVRVGDIGGYAPYEAAFGGEVTP